MTRRPQIARYVAAFAVAAGVCVFAFVLVRATLLPAAEPEASAPPAAALRSGPVAAGDVPVRLSIPSIGVSAAVQQAGIAKSGNMAVPSNFTDAAWYKYGPAPGMLGSAVIDGHVDNGLSLAGVFKHLNEIKVGDEILVQNAGGTELRFTVSDIQIYDYKSVPTELVFNRADQARLNLVTCDGAWVAGEKTYNQRLVVYATLNS